jgi:hypothetical protein
MRKTMAIAALTALLICVGGLGTLFAADSPATATGSWKWTVQTPDGDSLDMSARLTQDGQKLSGTFLDGFDQKTFDIKDGKVADGNVSFTVTRPFNDDTITVKYTGKLSDDSIKGSLEIKFGDQDPVTNDWLAKRVKDESPATQPSTRP